MKKFFSICMLFALVVSLTACGDTAEESPGTSDSGGMKDTPTYTFSFAGIGGTETIDTIAMQNAAARSMSRPTATSRSMCSRRPSWATIFKSTMRS